MPRGSHVLCCCSVMNPPLEGRSIVSFQHLRYRRREYVSEPVDVTEHPLVYVEVSYMVPAFVAGLCVPKEMMREAVAQIVVFGFGQADESESLSLLNGGGLSPRILSPSFPSVPWVFLVVVGVSVRLESWNFATVVHLEPLKFPEGSWCSQGGVEGLEGLADGLGRHLRTCGFI